MRRRPDTKSGDLFAIPSAPHDVPGALNFDMQLRHILSQSLKQSPKSRYEIAAHMSELLGEDVSKYQLDTWTAESKEGWRFPLAYLCAFESACETHAVTQFISKKRGCTLNIGDESLAAKLGQLEMLRAETAKQITAIKKYMRER